MARVAGVDSSTQSVKIVVRDSDSGELLAQASHPHPDGTEVDPQHWLTALYAVINEVGGLDSLDAISIGGQQHGMVLPTFAATSPGATILGRITSVLPLTH